MRLSRYRQDLTEALLRVTYLTGPFQLQIHQHAREAFLSGKAKSIAFRKEQIAQVGYLLKDNEQRIKDALRQDLNRPDQETDLYVRARYISLVVTSSSLPQF